MKITDLDKYADAGEPIYHRYLEFLGPNEKNVGGKSNKFWEVAIFKRGSAFIMVCRWGKYGAKGQSNEKIFYSEWSAENAAWEKAQKKRDKGYGHEIDVITRLGATLDDA